MTTNLAAAGPAATSGYDYFRRANFIFSGGGRGSPAAFNDLRRGCGWR